MEILQSPVNSISEHRTSCHRCGNMRKGYIECGVCPQIFCINCSTKLKSIYGELLFDKGCPVCKSLCCCSDKSSECQREFHCYKKCPTTKQAARISKGKRQSPSSRTSVDNSPTNKTWSHASTPTSPKTTELSYIDCSIISPRSNCSMLDDSVLIIRDQTNLDRISDAVEGYQSSKLNVIDAPSTNASPQSNKRKRTYSGVTRPAESTPKDKNVKRSPDKNGFDPQVSVSTQRVKIASPLLAPSPTQKREKLQQSTIPVSDVDLFSGILVPQSLTLETNPFFMQSAISTTQYPLQSIQPLIEKSNEYFCSFYQPFESVPFAGFVSELTRNAIAERQSASLPVETTAVAAHIQQDTQQPNSDSSTTTSSNHYSSSAQYWDMLDHMHRQIHSQGDTSSMELGEFTTSSGHGRHMPSSASLYSLDKEGVLFNTPQEIRDCANHELSGLTPLCDLSTYSQGLIDGATGGYRSLYEKNNQTIHELGFGDMLDDFSPSVHTNTNSHLHTYSTPAGQRVGRDLNGLEWTGGSCGSLLGLGFGLEFFTPIDTTNGVTDHSCTQQSHNNEVNKESLSSIQNLPRITTPLHASTPGRQSVAQHDASPMDLETYTLFSSLFRDMHSSSDEGQAEGEGEVDSCDFFSPMTDEVEPAEAINGAKEETVKNDDTTKQRPQLTATVLHSTQRQHEHHPLTTSTLPPATPHSIYSCSSSVLNAGGTATILSSSGSQSTPMLMHTDSEGLTPGVDRLSGCRLENEYDTTEGTA